MNRKDTTKGSHARSKEHDVELPIFGARENRLLDFDRLDVREL